MKFKNTKEIKPVVQKFAWRGKKTFSSYQEANDFKNILIEKGESPVKIRRIGPSGLFFRVFVGQPVKQKDSTKKGVKDARK